MIVDPAIKNMHGVVSGNNVCLKLTDKFKDDAIIDEILPEIRNLSLSKEQIELLIQYFTRVVKDKEQKRKVELLAQTQEVLNKINKKFFENGALSKQLEEMEWVDYAKYVNWMYKEVLTKELQIETISKSYEKKKENKQARIDTEIGRQTGKKYSWLNEIIANSVDACGGEMGTFGVGWKQVLAEKFKRIRINTVKELEQISLEFKKESEVVYLRDVVGKVENKKGSGAETQV
ncbi:hypothetical protein ACFL5N_02245, partial [bacterium]